MFVVYLNGGVCNFKLEKEDSLKNIFIENSFRGIFSSNYSPSISQKIKLQPSARIQTKYDFLYE
jgi:hypothetical protein